MKKLTILFLITTAHVVYSEELYITVTSTEKIPVITSEQQGQLYEKDDFETLLDESEENIIVHEMRPVSWLEAQLQRISLAIVLPLYSAKNWCSAKIAACITYLSLLYSKK